MQEKMRLFQCLVFPCRPRVPPLPDKGLSDFCEKDGSNLWVRVHDVVVAGSIKQQSTMSWPLTVRYVVRLLRLAVVVARGDWVVRRYGLRRR
jgi:hypothetical protein